MFQLFANRRFLLIALIFLLITWVMFVTSHKRTNESESKVEYFFHTAMTPLESVFNSLGRVVGDSWQTVANLAKLKVENDRLRMEIGHLKAEQIGLDQLKKENDQLKSALQFQASQPHELVPAEVISANPSNWNQTVIINKGRNFNLKKNMAVITSQGVAGRIGEVREDTAEVILITDPRDGNFIGGVIARTGNVVFVTGGGYFRGECTVKPAVESYFVGIRKNDLILTAETSEIFPRGIPLGRIISLNRTTNKMISQASLKPAVDLSRLNVVYVIKTKKDPPLTLNNGG